MAGEQAAEKSAGKPAASPSLQLYVAVTPHTFTFVEANKVEKVEGEPEQEAVPLPASVQLLLGIQHSKAHYSIRTRYDVSVFLQSM